MAELVSVIMSIYNESFDWVKSAIDSILEQTWRAIELIVVLDNPDNISLNEQVKNYVQKSNRVRIIHNTKNLGLPCSLNKAMDLCMGRYIARMDADDISAKDRIELELEYMWQNDLDMVASARMEIDEYGKLVSNKKKVPEDGQVKIILPYVCCITHSSVLIKAETLKSMGGYRNISTCEDYDLWLRMLTNGCKFGIVNKPLQYYRIRSTSIGNSNNFQQRIMTEYVQKLYRERKRRENHDSYSEENIEMFLRKHHYYDIKNEKKFTMARQNMEKGFKMIEENRKVRGICNIIIGMRNVHTCIQIFELLYYKLILKYRPKMESL